MSQPSTAQVVSVETPATVSWEATLHEALGQRPGASWLQKLRQKASEDPVWRARLADALRASLVESPWPVLLAQTDLGLERGVGAEFLHRLSQKWIPPTTREEAFRRALVGTFSAEDGTAIESLFPREWIALIRTLFTREEESALAKDLRQSISQALLLLGTEIAAFGMSQEVRDRLPGNPVQDSPFLRLNLTLYPVVQYLQDAHLPEGEALVIFEVVGGALDRAFEAVRAVFSKLETQGVSVSLVYRLDSLTRYLERVDLLLRIAIRNAPVIHYGLVGHLLAQLIQCSHSRLSLRELMQAGLRLHARKIVERTGHSGEHYITRDRKEYYQMLGSSAGGGLLTVGTGFMKTVIAELGTTAARSGWLTWLDYSGSFLCLQFFGFSLASKQPPMTASAMARRLRDLDYRFNVDDFLDDVACLTRSQWAAFVGNIGAVLPGALLFCFLFRLLAGHPVFGSHDARGYLHDIDPFHSLCLVYAAWTGLLLWLSSLLGGWVENWMVFHRIPLLVSQNRKLFRLIGESRTAALANWIAANSCGIGANVSLGFLLAFTRNIGIALHLPLEVRHVTISMVSLVFSSYTLGPQVTWSQVLIGFLGVFLIGLLNFTVSFCLALWIAAKARGVRRGWFRYLVNLILGRFFSRPLPFLLPTKTK